MAEVEVVPSTFQHIIEIRKTLREGDKKEVLALGLDPYKACTYSYRQALWRRTGLIDGEPAAIWGLRGNVLGLKGEPYLLTNDRIHLTSPLKFARIYMSQVEEMKKLFPLLENYVDADYHGAIRMLKIAGFTVSDPIFMKNHYFRRFSLISD